MTARQHPEPGTYATRPVLVLGATGFIGRWVARALCAQGAEVHVTARDPSFAAPLLQAYSVSATVHAADLCEPGRLADLIRTVKPWVTFNLAGYGVDPRERDESVASAVNRDLVDDLCSVIASSPPDHRSRLVHVGSALEYGTARGDLDEDTPPAPDTLYGRTKLAGTLAVARARAEQGLQALTARLFMVYGPGERPGRLLPTLLAAAGTTERIALTEGRQRRDFTFVEDVADGLLRLGLAAASAPAIVNLARGRLDSVRSFVQTVAEVTGISSDRLGFGDLPTRREEMAHDPVAIHRLRRATDGWSPPTGLADGIRATLAFPTPLVPTEGRP